MKLKTSMMCMLILTLILICNCEKRNNIPEYKGPYLGQESPGLSPEIFAPGFISTGLNETKAAFSPDGRVLYFDVAFNPSPSSYNSIILKSEIKKGVWTAPETAEFSGKYIDGAPFISPNGSKLFFQSDRPVNNPENKNRWNIWYLEKDGENWSEPKPAGPPVNGNGDVFGPSVSENGNLYFTRSLKDGRQVIFRSEYKNGKYQEPVLLPEQVNSTNSQFDGCISPDESYMILPVYGRKDAVGSTDCYVTFRDKDGKWSPLVNLGDKFNTRRVDCPACISADGKYIFYGSKGFDKKIYSFSKPLKYRDLKNYLNGPGAGNFDIYWVEAKIIEGFRQDK